MRQLSFAVAVSFATAASADAVPPVPSSIDAYATKLELECSSTLGSSGSGIQRIPKLIQSITELARGKIYVVDGSYTACGVGYPLCGTGGCPIGVFLVRGKVVLTLYMDQVLGWNLSPNGKKIVMTVHGSFCGGHGPDPCAVDIDLTTGKKRNFVPKN
jgi:hypothetical protein